MLLCMLCGPHTSRSCPTDRRRPGVRSGHRHSFQRHSHVPSTRHVHSLLGVCLIDRPFRRGASKPVQQHVPQPFPPSASEHPRLFSHRERHLTLPSNDGASFSKVNGLSAVVRADKLSFHPLVCVRVVPFRFLGRLSGLQDPLKLTRRPASASKSSLMDDAQDWRNNRDTLAVLLVDLVSETGILN